MHFDLGHFRLFTLFVLNMSAKFFLFFSGHLIGHHVQLHVGHHWHHHGHLHVGHRNIISTLCEVSETLTECESEKV